MKFVFFGLRKKDKMDVVMKGIMRQCPRNFWASTAPGCVYASTPYGLRSAAIRGYITPRLRPKFGEQAFSYAGSATWNRLLENTRFRRLLKTFLFAEFLLLYRTLTSPVQICKRISASEVFIQRYALYKFTFYLLTYLLNDDDHDDDDEPQRELN